MVAPNFCQNPTRQNAGFFFLEKLLISGEKMRFSKKVRAGAMPLSRIFMGARIFLNYEQTCVSDKKQISMAIQPRRPPHHLEDRNLLELRSLDSSCPIF